MLNDFTALINDRFPLKPNTDWLDQERAQHEAYARSHRSVYIGRASYDEVLDQHASCDDSALLVLGESGSGKSALLAHWADRFGKKHPNVLLLEHYVGSSPLSAHWPALVRRLLGELRRHFNMQFDIPDAAEPLREKFSAVLLQAASHGGCVLIIDALDQLEDREGALDLVWLPTVLPEHIRLLASTLPGPALDAARKRGWTEVLVTALTSEERHSLIRDWLKPRQLSPALEERLAGASACASPLFLRTLLEELRLCAEHETVGPLLDYYLEAAGPQALFELILTRYEHDYETERPLLVRDAMSALWASRRGLSEEELVQFLGDRLEPIPRAWLEPLYLAADVSLLNRSGFIGFRHDYFRKAVHHKYLSDRVEEMRTHRKLAEYFSTRTLDQRQVEELPWQWLLAEEWNRLAELLGQPSFLAAAWPQHLFDVQRFWSVLEERSSRTKADVYLPTVCPPIANPDHAGRVASLLFSAGDLERAYQIWSMLAEQTISSGQPRSAAVALNGMALVMKQQGDLDSALEIQQRIERICRDLQDLVGLQGSLGNQAVILKRRGRFDAALVLLKEVEAICRQLGNLNGLALSLSHQAVILQERGDLEGSMRLLAEEERIARQTGDPEQLQSSLGNQGTIQYQLGHLDAAMSLFKQAEQICRTLGKRADLQRSLGNQGAILQRSGALDAALDLYYQEETLCREVQDTLGLMMCLEKQADLRIERGERIAALSVLHELEQLCRRTADSSRLTSCLRCRGQALGQLVYECQQSSDFESAIDYLEDLERVLRELSDPEGLQRVLGLQSLMLCKAKKRPLRAMALLKEQERICLRLGDDASLRRNRQHQAALLDSAGSMAP